ncbi:LuxR C-terminal-related transcriptional regulator [Streptomyces sp. NPDC001493]
MLDDVAASKYWHAAGVRNQGFGRFPRARMGTCRFTQAQHMGDVRMLRKSLSTFEAATYQAVAAGDSVEPGPVTDRLAELGLIERQPHGTWVAHDPRAVAHDLLGGALDDLRALVDRIHNVPALESLTDAYDPHRMYGGPASEFLPSRDGMNARIGDVSASAAESVLTAQPGAPADRDPAVVAMGARRVVGALEAGVSVRSLYASAAVSHNQTASYVSEIIDAGAEVRTLSGVFPRLMIVDGRHLFVDNHVVSGAGPDAGWHVSDRASVAWAERVFEALWDRGVRWGDAKPRAGSVTTDRQRQILGELEAGWNKQQAAKRLGISERTVTGELSQLREKLGMRTLYQVMAWWASSRDRQPS